MLPERVTPGVKAIAASMSARNALVKSAASAPPSPPGRGMAGVTLAVKAGTIVLERWTVEVSALPSLTLVLAWVSEKVWVSLSRMVVVTLLGPSATVALVALVVGADSARL